MASPVRGVAMMRLKLFMIMLLINWIVILRKSSCGGDHLGLDPRFFLHLAEKWAASSSKLLSFLPFVLPQELPCYHGIGFVMLIILEGSPALPWLSMEPWMKLFLFDKGVRFSGNYPNL